MTTDEGIYENWYDGVEKDNISLSGKVFAQGVGGLDISELHWKKNFFGSINNCDIWSQFFIQFFFICRTKIQNPDIILVFFWVRYI